MKQHSSNQQTGRKYSGSSSFTESGTPSKAPGQDQQLKESLGPRETKLPHADKNSSQQGISNRPANEEHAFPESAPPEDDLDGPDSLDTDGQQMGGNRGGV